MTERNRTEHWSRVAYQPKILRTMREICEEMGVGEKRVKAWIEQGAPVAVERSGDRVWYSAESARLQAWREAGTESPARERTCH